MRQHRAHHPNLAPQITLRGEEVAHLRVLRAREGDSIQIFDGAGREANGHIVALHAHHAVVDLQAPSTSTLETPQAITLCVALLKADKLVDVVRASTELGVRCIQPTITQHSDSKDMGAGKLERLRRVALEACKQSRRATIPTIQEPLLLRDLPSVACGLVAHPKSNQTPRQALHTDTPIWLASGPEGGFGEEDLETLAHKGFVRVGLGRRILRAETAALALVASVTAAENW